MYRFIMRTVPKAPAERHIINNISPRWGFFEIGNLFSIDISSRWDFLRFNSYTPLVFVV